MKKKQVLSIGIALMLALSLSACGNASSSYATDEAVEQDQFAASSYKAGAVNDVAESFAATETAAEMDDYEPEYEEAVEDNGDNTSSLGVNENVAQNRKLVKRVSVTAETREFDKLTAHIEKKVETLGGYMENAQVYSGSSYSGNKTRNASYVARVPVARMGELVEDVGQNANITNKSESAEDVTLNYVDNQSRKEALEVEMDRLMEILKQAEDVDTIVALESRITEVRYEIQSIESTLRTYDNLVDFATVNISIQEVEVYTPEPVQKVSDWDRMTQGFVHSLQSVGRGILDFLIDLVIALPYLILWGVIILVIVLVVKKWIKGRDRRIEKRAARKAEKAARAQKRLEEAAIRRAEQKKEAQAPLNHEQKEEKKEE